MLTTAGIALLAGLVLPQVQTGTPTVGPSTASNAIVLYESSGGSGPGRRLDYGDPANEKFAPLVSSNGPIATDWSAAGTADFDGDGNRDSWFLSPDATGTGGETGGIFALEGQPARRVAMAVQMGRASSLGRYRAWHTWEQRNWVHGATFRSSDYTVERVLLVDPRQTALTAAYYSEVQPGRWVWVENQWWSVGSGAYRIATRDDSGDGHDDIVVLRTVPGGTQVKKLRVDSQLLGWAYPETEATLELPWPVDEMCLLDFDADGSSDVLLTIPGVGVLLVRDDGKNLVPWFSLGAWIGQQRLFVGDADRDGRDDFGIVYQRGILMVMSTGSGFVPQILVIPAACPDLHAGAVLGDHLGNLTSVVAFPQDGASFVIFPLDAGGTFGAPTVVNTVDPATFVGSGASGTPLMSADVDGDDDEDVVMQLPDRRHWLTLRNGEVRLAPVSVGETSYGVVAPGLQADAFTLQISDDAVARGLDTIEIAAFMANPNDPDQFSYWGRLITKVNPTARTAMFTVYTELAETAVLNLWASTMPGKELYNGGLRVGGETLLSVHLKSGTQRFQSLLIHLEEDGGGGGNKSGVGVKWKVRAAPPKADMDADLLPWN